MFLCNICNVFKCTTLHYPIVLLQDGHVHILLKYQLEMPVISYGHIVTLVRSVLMGTLCSKLVLPLKWINSYLHLHTIILKHNIASMSDNILWLYRYYIILSWGQKLFHKKHNLIIISFLIYTYWFQDFFLESRLYNINKAAYQISIIEGEIHT